MWLRSCGLTRRWASHAEIHLHATVRNRSFRRIMRSSHGGRLVGFDGLHCGRHIWPEDRINPPAREVGRDKGVGRGGVRATGNPLFDSVMYVMYTVPKSVPITQDKYLSSLLLATAYVGRPAFGEISM